MKKKTISKIGKGLIFAGVGFTAMVFSAWILVSVVQLALAIAIGVTAWVLFPAFYELLLYGQFTSMMKIWQGNPMFALQRNKMDMVDELNHRQAAVRKLGQGVHRSEQKLNERARTNPQDAALFRPQIETQRCAYEFQLTALKNAEKAVERYDAVIERADFMWTTAMDMNQSASLINALGNNEATAIRQLREDAAIRGIMDEAAAAMSELDMVMTNRGVMKETKAGKQEGARQQSVIEHDNPDTFHYPPKGEKQGLFSGFNKE